MTQHRLLAASVAAALRPAGWLPGRRVPELVAAWELQIEKQLGVTMPMAARDALVVYGGLNSASLPGYLGSVFRIDPTDAACSAPLEYSIACSELGGGCYPIGSCQHTDIVITHGGEYFLTDGDLAWWVGTCLEDVLEGAVAGAWRRRE